METPVITDSTDSFDDDLLTEARTTYKIGGSAMLSALETLENVTRELDEEYTNYGAEGFKSSRTIEGPNSTLDIKYHRKITEDDMDDLGRECSATINASLTLVRNEIESIVSLTRDSKSDFGRSGKKEVVRISNADSIAFEEGGKRIKVNSLSESADTISLSSNILSDADLQFVSYSLEVIEEMKKLLNSEVRAGRWKVIKKKIIGIWNWIKDIFNKH